MRGDSNPEGEFCNHPNGKDLPKPSLINSVNNQHLLCSDCHGLALNDPQLKRLINLWPELQEHHKLAILALASIHPAVAEPTRIVSSPHLRGQSLGE